MASRPAQPVRVPPSNSPGAVSVLKGEKPSDLFKMGALRGNKPRTVPIPRK